MTTRTTDLYLLEDLEEDGRAPGLPDDERDALRAIGSWVRSFVIQPHAELGRPGTVCPYVPVSVERQKLWLAPEQIGDGGAAQVAELMNGYKRRLFDVSWKEVGVTEFDVIIVAFTDLPAARAESLFDEVLGQIAIPSYTEDGVLFGPYYDGNQATAIYNKGFRPFESPVPFLFVRHGVVGDWKFFLDQDEMLSLRARRFGESATLALAHELRRLPWNARRG